MEVILLYYLLIYFIFLTCKINLLAVEVYKGAMAESHRRCIAEFDLHIEKN
jgi:hypothetical protein